MALTANAAENLQQQRSDQALGRDRFPAAICVNAIELEVILPSDMPAIAGDIVHAMQDIYALGVFPRMAGVWAIFGHGNVAGLGEALAHVNRPPLLLLPGDSFVSCAPDPVC